MGGARVCAALNRLLTIAKSVSRRLCAADDVVVGGWHRLRLFAPGNTSSVCMWARFRVSKDRSSGATQQVLQTDKGAIIGPCGAVNIPPSKSVFCMLAAALLRPARAATSSSAVIVCPTYGIGVGQGALARGMWLVRRRSHWHAGFVYVDISTHVVMTCRLFSRARTPAACLGQTYRPIRFYKLRSA